MLRFLKQPLSLFLFTCGFFFVLPVDAADICPSLKRAKESAENRFANIKGQNDASTIRMPGMRDVCSLSDIGGIMPMLICDWEFESLDQAHRFYDEMMVAVRSCLGGYPKMQSESTRHNSYKTSSVTVNRTRGFSMSYPASPSSKFSAIEVGVETTVRTRESFRTNQTKTSIEVSLTVFASE